MVEYVQTMVEVDHSSIEQAVAGLVEQAKEANRERRASVREPFFGPVNVTLEENGLRRTYSSLSRDISLTGIGLLHSMPLCLGPVLLTVHQKRGESLRLRSEIVWCRPCGAGWYLSGARFLATE